MSSPQPSSFEDPKPRFEKSRKVRLVITSGLVLGLLLAVALPVSLVYGLRARRNRQGVGATNSSDSRGCTPEAYSSGKWNWAPKTNITEMTSKEQSLVFSGFETCGADGLFWWNLAADHPERFFRFPKAHSYTWEPSSKCQGLEQVNPEALVKHLVEVGGWYIIGDSVSHNHFFSISCTLGRHVIVPERVPEPGESYIDTSGPLHIYLNPASPLTAILSLPTDFDIAKTPLVTARRVDLLWSVQEIQAFWDSMQDKPLQDGKTVFTHEIAYTIPFDTYLADFLEPLPKASYSAMIMTTGAHWARFHFNGTSPDGIPGIMKLFKVVAKNWVDHFQDVVGKANRECDAAGESCKSPRRRAIIRDYVEGHYDCENIFEPSTTIMKAPPDYWNWRDMPKFNAVWTDLLKTGKYPDIEQLSIARPGQLRPDSHVNGDCLHPMTGSGVMEGWTQYIFHYLTKESP